MIKSNHELSWCAVCGEIGIEIVICGKCGNNCCNGGYGNNYLALVVDTDGNYVFDHDGRISIDWKNSQTCDMCKEAYEHQSIFYNGGEIIFQKMYGEENEEWNKYS